MVLTTITQNETSLSMFQKLGLGSKLGCLRAEYNIRHLRSLTALTNPASFIIRPQVRESNSLLHGQPPLVCVRMSSDEVSKAQEAAKDTGISSEPTIFAKIVNKEIPAEIIHEDEKVWQCGLAANCSG